MSSKWLRSPISVALRQPLPTGFGRDPLAGGIDHGANEVDDPCLVHPRHVGYAPHFNLTSVALLRLPVFGAGGDGGTDGRIDAEQHKVLCHDVGFPALAVAGAVHADTPARQGGDLLELALAHHSSSGMLRMSNQST